MATIRAITVDHHVRIYEPVKMLLIILGIDLSLDFVFFQLNLVRTGKTGV